MNEMDYTFFFSDLGVFGKPIQFENRRDRSRSPLYLSIDDHALHYGASPRRAILADMVDVAIAVYTADRFSLRPRDEKVAIRLVIPVRHPEIIGSAKLVHLLTRAIEWYTGDHWCFEFTLRTGLGRETEVQSPLFQQKQPHDEIALWSGGLDSLGGLFDRLATAPENTFVLVGVGDNPIVEHLQREILSQVRRDYSNLSRVQVTWKAQDHENLSRNSSARARGFAFLLLGAVTALVEGQQVLHVYENGIGALNLPFRASEVGLAHSRAVHPLSVVRMERLVSEWIGETFRIENPYFFMTKAETVKKIASSHLRDLIWQTRSCDSVRREPGKSIQCGSCSSCLLRRAALAALKVEDKTPYLVTQQVQNGAAFQAKEGDFLRAMLTQVETFKTLLNDPDPWCELAMQYSDLNDVADWNSPVTVGSPDSRTQITNLFQRYTKEWQSVWESISPGLLDNAETLSWRDKLNIR